MKAFAHLVGVLVLAFREALAYLNKKEAAVKHEQSQKERDAMEENPGAHIRDHFGGGNASVQPTSPEPTDGSEADKADS